MSIDIRLFRIIVLGLILGLAYFQIRPKTIAKQSAQRLILMVNAGFLQNETAKKDLAEAYIEKLHQDWDQKIVCTGGLELYNISDLGTSGSPINLLPQCRIEEKEAKLVSGSWLTKENIEDKIRKNFADLNAVDNGCEQIIYSLNTLKKVLSNYGPDEQVSVVYASSWLEQSPRHDPRQGDYQMVSNNLSEGSYEFRDWVLRDLEKQLRNNNSALVQTAKGLNKMILGRNIKLKNIYTYPLESDVNIRISQKDRVALDEFWNDLFLKAGLNRIPYHSFQEAY